MRRSDGESRTSATERIERSYANLLKKTPVENYNSIRKDMAEIMAQFSFIQMLPSYHENEKDTDFGQMLLGVEKNIETFKTTSKR